MRRDRLTWVNGRQANRRKMADPYTMHQERYHAPADAYVKGDPAEWAEEPVADLSHFEAEGRNEIGLPEFLEGTWHGGREASGTRMAQMQRHFEKKALQCVRIARALLPHASDDVIVAQALDLMPLPNDSIYETASRLAGEGAMEEEEEMPKEALRRMMSEEHAEMGEEDSEASWLEEEEAGLEASWLEEDGELEPSWLEEEEMTTARTASPSDVRRLVAEELSRFFRTQRVSAEEEEGEEEEEEHEEKEEKESSKKSSLRSAPKAASEDMLGEEDLDMLLSEMEAEEGGHATAELDLSLEPELDLFEGGEELLEESDESLYALMNRHHASKKASSAKAGKGKVKPVSQLGRVKEASATGTDELSKLWSQAPDVSKVFNGE